MNTMEAVISEDLIKEMLEPGKAFQRHLAWEKSQQLKSERPLASLILEKMADGVIKIKVSVPKPFCEKNPESTSKSDVQQNKVSNSAQQTDTAETESRIMQTEKKCETSQQQQTEKKESQESGFQTPVREYREISIQTVNKEFVEGSVQTVNKEFVEGAAQTVNKEFCESQTQTVIKEFRESLSQTVIKEFSAISCQTVIKEFSETPCQTVIKEFSETPCQTVIKEFSETSCQTVIKDFAESLCQTDFSLANLVESECQATTSMSTGYSQTEIEMTDQVVQATTSNMDNVSQTEIICSDSSIQTEKDEGIQECQTELSMLLMFDNTSQTVIDIASRDSQTDSSFAFMEEFGCQMSPDMSELSVQTESTPVRPVHCQTEIPTQFAETQTVADLSNSETQTEELKPLSAYGAPQGAAAEGMELPMHLVEQMPTDGDFILPSADIQSITPLGIVNMTPPVDKTEACVQTEPVTIIIGDASFLVEKLKGTPVKNDKNQIEIEFSENGTPEVRYRRSGYIPGSGLTAPSLPGRIPLDKLKSTPVQPFNPRLIENIQLLRSDAAISPRKHTPVRRQPEKSVVHREPVLQAIDEYEVKQELNCPFCETTFRDSTTLYQHITKLHNEMRQKTHYKPKGREGLTILPTNQRSKFVSPDDDKVMPPHVRASVERYRLMAMAAGKPPPSVSKKHTRRPRATIDVLVSPEPLMSSEPAYQSPPVLEAVYMTNEVELISEDGQGFSPTSSARTYTKPPPTIQAEPNIFDDLPEPKRAFPRGRVRRAVEEEDAAPQQTDAYEYECPHCPERYGSATHLYSHLKRSHKPQMEQQQEDTQESLIDTELGPDLNESRANSDVKEESTNEARENSYSELQQEGEEPEVVEQTATDEDIGDEHADADDEREPVGAEADDELAGAEEEEDDREVDAEEADGDEEVGEEQADADVEQEITTEHISEEPAESEPTLKRKRKSVGRPPKKRKINETEAVAQKDESVEEELPVLHAPDRGRTAPAPNGGARRPGRPRKDTGKVKPEPDVVKKLTRTRKPRNS